MRYLVLFLALLAAGPAAAFTPPVEASDLSFQIDDEGNVYWVDSFGGIRRNGGSLGYHPGSGTEWEVGPQGDVYFVDSYGSLKVNGAAYTSKPVQGRFWLTPAGNLFWIEGYWNYLLKNGHSTRYPASWRSPVREDAQGRIWYIDEDSGRLHRDGQDQGLHLDGALYWLDAASNVYFLGGFQGNRRPLLVHEQSTGRQRLLDWATAYGRVVQDRQGRLWYPAPYGALRRDGHEVPGIVVGTGEFHLDDEGHIYHVIDERIHRDGADTGYVSQGPFHVTPSGDVIHVIDRSWGTVARNGSSLGISIR